MSTRSVLSEVTRERANQDDKWGEQNHPDRKGAHDAHTFGIIADTFKAMNDKRAENGTPNWTDVWLEEVYEALAEEDPARLREELIQAIAVGVAWVEAIDRREGKPEPKPETVYPDIEIVEWVDKTDKYGPVVNDLIIDGVSVGAAYEPVTIECGPEQLTTVNATLIANSVRIEQRERPKDPEPLPEFRPSDKFPDVAYVRRMTGRA